MSFSRGPKIVTDGLVLCLDAANKKSYPGSGTTWTDLSGQGNNGTLTNMSATPFDSGNGGSLVFDGVNDYIGLNSSFQVSTNNIYSITAWIYKAGSSVNNAGALFSGGYGGDVDGIIIFTDSYLTTDDIRISSSNGNVSAIFYNGVSQTLTTNTYTSVNFNLNEWIHIAVTGINVNSTYGGVHTIGANNNGTNYFEGKISSVKLYSKELTPQEIQQNYNATKTRFGL